MKQYMDEFYKQLLAPLTDYKQKEFVLQSTTFMTKVTDSILVHL